MTIARGDFHKPAPGYGFTVNQDVWSTWPWTTGPAALGDGWEKTPLKLAWRDIRTASIARRSRPAAWTSRGTPPEHKPGDYGVPHLCFVKPVAPDGGRLEITALPAGLKGRAVVPDPDPAPAAAAAPDERRRRA